LLLQWKARDYVRSLTKPSTDPGYLVEGDDRTPTDISEAWTFVKHRDGKWLLSAIQQVD
jgi:predicted lipid-binding transport protein (Tim44 family)